MQFETSSTYPRNIRQIRRRTLYEILINSFRLVYGAIMRDTVQLCTLYQNSCSLWLRDNIIKSHVTSQGNGLLKRNLEYILFRLWMNSTSHYRYKL